jgi:hypothetical protein
MDTPHDVSVRSSRDRIIDLLGIGDTYPLTDLNVVADQLKVAFGGTAKIPIEDAQAGVVYQLCDPKGNSLGDKFKAEGEDATLVIETPVVAEDVTYRILAQKISGPPPPQAPRYLDESAPVKVGIDTQLVIEILQAPLLDATNANPQPADARIVTYGTSVDVRVNNSQEGVQYSLILNGADAKQSITGDLGAVVLSTGPMYEDSVIQVRATKAFLATQNRGTQTTPLDAKLYLKVSANPALAVSAAPVPLEYRRDATITIAGTQASASYRAYARRIPDADFIHGAPRPGAGILTIPLPGKPDAQVRKPAPPSQPEPWRAAEDYAALGYVALGEAPVQGTGGDITIPLAALADDAIVIVAATKRHQADPNGKTFIDSIVRLDQSAAVLVRPDPARALTLRTPVIGAQTGASLQVSGGQPGVFYFFRLASASADLALPAYFHKLDDADPTQNEGVDQLGVEIDLAIAADSDARPAALDRAHTPPRAPVLDIAPVATGSSVSIRAVKAQTLLEASALQSAQIPGVPAIRADQAVIDYGAAAKIVIPASDPKDLYLVTLGGAPVRAEIPGDSTDATVISDPLTADASFEVIVARPADKSPSVERVVSVSVSVRPDAALALSARQDSVMKGTGTDVLVHGCQVRVVYQLQSASNAIGAAVAGTGGDIALPTGPLSADTTFGVAATRADNPSIATVLQAQVAVKVIADAAPAPTPDPAAPPAPDAGPVPSGNP